MIQTKKQQQQRWWWPEHIISKGSDAMVKWANSELSNASTSKQVFM